VPDEVDVWGTRRGSTTPAKKRMSRGGMKGVQSHSRKRFKAKEREREKMHQATKKEHGCWPKFEFQSWPAPLSGKPPKKE